MDGDVWRVEKFSIERAEHQIITITVKCYGKVKNQQYDIVWRVKLKLLMEPVKLCR